MLKRLLFSLQVSFFSVPSFAQMQPLNGDTLNYRLIGFSAPHAKEEVTYVFEIAEGYISTERDFKKANPIKKTSDSNRIIFTVPSFGKDYTWRVSLLNGRKKKRCLVPLSHFYVGTTRSVDTTRYRNHVVTPATIHKDLLVFVDHQKALLDMEGKPVWYLPIMPGVADSTTSIRDLKPTGRGTFTFLADYNGYEIDYDGNVLWQTPNTGMVSRDTSEHYHHEFTRLSTGNYMIYKFEAWVRKDKEGNYWKKIECGTLIEYDSSGNVVWSWRSSDVFTDEDLFTNKTPNGAVFTSTHQNGFHFDEKNKVIYVSFRDISRVMKIEYPSGKLLRSYGNEGGTDTTTLFRAQHSCFINSQGNLCLFDNHVPAMRDRGQKGLTSYVKIFREPAGNSGPLTTIWEFPCNFDAHTGSLALRGGSVRELADNSLLVSMGSVNRIFIVDPRKKVPLWNILLEFKDINTNIWRPVGSYRVSGIHDIFPFIFR